MGVTLGGRTVCRPACVGDAERSFHLRPLSELGERCNATDTAQAMQAAVDHGQAGGIVAAILELAQTLQQYGDDVAVGDGADYSTHVRGLWSDLKGSAIGYYGLRATHHEPPITSSPFSLAVSNP